MSRNYKYSGGTIKIVASEQVSSGQVWYVGNLFGIAMNSAAVGENFILSISGVYELPKVPNLAIQQGTKLYWNSEYLTPYYGVFVGYAAEAETSGSDTCLVRLSGDFESSNIIFINSVYDLPASIDSVITLEAAKTYFITTTIDLLGSRIVARENTTIIGGSSENCILKSTGLSGTALITSAYSLPIRNITITAQTALDLDAGTWPNSKALDWFGVNFTDCENIGTIQNYNNFIATDCAFLNSQGLIFDGNVGTVGFINTLFDNRTGGTTITVAATAIINRRFRISYSSFVSLSGETAINFSTDASVLVESYILDTVNFSGGGTYTSGVDVLSNKTLFINCVGIQNTSVHGQMYMRDNVTATTILNTTDFVKVAGTTTPYDDNEKYTHANNRLTNDAVIQREYMLTATVSFNSGNNNICEFGFYDSQTSQVLARSIIKSTSNTSGRAENVTFMTLIKASQGAFIEVHCRNLTGANNITVTDMNVVITQIA